MASSDDFDHNRTCSAYDMSRNLETVRVEGLTTAAICSNVTAPAGAVIPAGSRKTSTQWHPDWRLAVKLAEPGRLTTSVYNGQPDPFNGNAIASCAPSTAVLPDGKPIAVLCKQVEQATTDTDGHLGLAAALQSGVVNRQTSWTYNAVGQVLSQTDPLGNATNFIYYGDTTATHTLGDLSKVTNAKLQDTTYTQYDKAGQLLTSVDANGVTSSYTYDLRERLKTASVGGQTTTYDYWPTGQLKKVTSPDASFVSYTYDAAHRLTDVADSLNNTIHYTLDNLGNRTAESVKDPNGVLRNALSRSIDALGRTQQTTGRE